MPPKGRKRCKSCKTFQPKEEMVLEHPTVKATALPLCKTCAIPVIELSPEEAQELDEIEKDMLAGNETNWRDVRTTNTGESDTTDITVPAANEEEPSTWFNRAWKRVRGK